MPAIWIPKRLVQNDIINLAAKSPQEFAAQCEANYRQRVETAANAVLRSGCPVVMLTGPSASGKTTSAHKVAAELVRRGCPAQVLSLDNFYRNKENYPRLPDGSKDYENITALDLACVQKCISDLVQKGECLAPQFDFVSESRMEEWLPIARQGGVVLIEGIHALNPQLLSNLPAGSAYKIYAGLREEYCGLDGRRMMPTRDIRLGRRMTRDCKFRGHSPEKTLGMWDRVCQGEDTYIKVFKTEADLLLDTSFSYEICVLSGFVAPMAGTLPDSSPLCETLNDLAGRFAQFAALDAALLPPDSMLMEFYGA